MNLLTVPGPLQSHKSQALLLFTYQDEKNDGKCLCDTKFASGAKVPQLLKRALEEKRFKGASKESVFFRSVDIDGFEHILFVGVGPKKTTNNKEAIRIAAAIATRTLSREKVQSITVSVESLRKITKSPEEAGQVLAEGLLLGSYKYTELKSKKKDNPESPPMDVKLSLDDKALIKKVQSGAQTGIILAESTCFARDLGNAPANYLTPTVLANRAGTAAKPLGIKFTAFDLKEIQAQKMGCLLGVNKGSAEEPRFIIMEYNGGKKGDKPLVLIGKGLTFDSGGISIKPAPAMEEMKFDMCGAAAVIGATLAIARLKLKLNVVTLVASTENMPGDAAVKPGDVLVAMNGKTVEVNNTDAEGRLVLADALSYACKNYEPRLIVDAATLTGACVIALGNVFAGFFCKDEAVVKKVGEASVNSGERIWRLPLVNEYVDDMKGTYADLQNVSYTKGGGSSQAAGFLSQFVEDGIPWAHFDIAGVAYHTGGRSPYNPDKGASGAAVRLFTQLAMNL